jgi:hypothetical protein
MQIVFQLISANVEVMLLFQECNMAANSQQKTAGKR